MRVDGGESTSLRPRGGVRALSAGILAFGLLGPLRAPAGTTYICLQGVASNPTEVSYKYLFPNWTRTHVTTFNLFLCSTDPGFCDWGSAPENLKGITVSNYGTATAADIDNVYWSVDCGGASALTAMTYAGVWSGSDTWTWAGTSPAISACLVVPLRLYVDIDPCPAHGATVTLGLRADPVLNPAWPGGVTDAHGCMTPWGNVLDAMPKTIMYVAKERDVKFAAPGDTVTYRIWYGRPGTTDLSSITVTDTLPEYMHWNGVATPAPDVGWNPDSGPPIRLRWTAGGPLAVSGGRTGEIVYQATVDWGNMDWFEPGSGDVAAPEGSRLENFAHASFGNTSCGVKGYASQGAEILVRRFMFYMLGDNDAVFTGRVGLPDDEIIYTIFVKNLSASKTWWNVSMWDTVPAELDVWRPGFGHYDPCVGWTITPTGCAPAGAGKVVSPANRTILTWRLDMPPGETMQVQWKAYVRTDAAHGDQAVNLFNIQAEGWAPVINGTGHSGKPKIFTHVAPVVLRTMYVSYLGVGGGGLGQSGVSLTFYPLHRAGNFELRGIEYDSTSTYPTIGGVSASIGAYVGSCLAGMWCPASNGCGPERAPAHYSRWTAGCYPDSGSGSPAQPFHSIYKLTSNAPVLWQMFSTLHSEDHDSHTFTPSTSLTFSGFIHYMFLRDNSSGGGDTLNIVNTSIDAFDNKDPNLTTTIHLFMWNNVTRTYDHMRYHELDKESQYAKPPITATEGPRNFYKVISSDAKLLIRQAAMAFGIRQGGAYNNYGTLSPTRENGSLVSSAVGDTFYIFPASKRAPEAQVIIGNPNPTAGNPVTYRIEKYVPKDPYDRPADVPLWMGGTSGTWEFVLRDVADSGLPTGAKAAHIYGAAYDNSYLFPTPDTQAGVWRVVQETSGQLIINSGIQPLSVYSGGCLLHPTDAGSGAMTGKDFWLHSGWNWSNNLTSHCDLADHGAIFTVDVFCSKPNMAINTISNDGYTTTYTSNGPDQCVAIKALTDLAVGAKRNVRIRLLAGGAQGNLIAMWNHCQPSHKFFTAPFLATGVHYDIIAPGFVYIGQEYWVTVVVVETAGDTKTDYCGTTTFTSTDPGFKVEGAPASGYAYTWDSDDAGATCKGAGCVAGCDNGVKIFMRLSMSRLGPQTIIASDTVDGSILGLTTVMVVGVDVKFWKEPSLAVRASGDTVDFRICWSNYSSTSAFAFVVNDAIPLGTTYLPAALSDSLCGSTSPVAFQAAYSTSNSATVPPAANFVTTGGIPPAGTYWLRWTLPTLGVKTTGCFCYRLRVD